VVVCSSDGNPFLLELRRGLHSGVIELARQSGCYLGLLFV
jgi:hypothetical protein